MELADMRDLGSRAGRHAGSTPVTRMASKQHHKVISRRRRRQIDRWCCFSFPNRTRCAGLRFGFLLTNCGRSTVRLTCRLCICDRGLEGSGSEWTAGGSPEPRPGSPAGEESHHRHGVRRSKHRSVSVLRRKLHYVSPFFLFRIEPASLGFNSGIV